MSVPSTYTSINETGCCPLPNVGEWDHRTVELHQQFIRLHTRCILHIPLNMGRVMTALQATADLAGAGLPAEKAMTLSRDLSPWKAEQLYAVSSPIAGADNVTLDGTFATCVFEGPYGKAGTWRAGVVAYAKSIGRTVEDVYFFYTTCPTCAKHYGKNYVIALGRLA
jgi:hypothetical protein